ncbi:MAG: hypothetical protein IKD69_14315, partial [Solobacterium sp.]|nr:hypothetical protein [Solobacterium sp.]
ETMSVSGNMLVKLFGMEWFEQREYERVNEKMIRLNIRESMAGRWFRVVISTFSSIGPMLIYFIGGLLMIRHGADLTVGDITVMVSLLSRMYGPVNSLLNIQTEWIRSMALFTRIFNYYDMPIEIRNAENPVKLEHPKGTVEFRNVFFRYNPERMILKDISFKLEASTALPSSDLPAPASQH